MRHTLRSDRLFRRRPLVLAVVVALVALAPGASRLRGQEGPRRLSVQATDDSVRAWATRTDDMLRNGLLDIASVQEDAMVPGRTHQRLGQRYQGLPVFGAELIRQLDGRAVISVFGTIFESVSLPTTTPSLTPAAAAALAEQAMGDARAGAPELGVLVTADGSVLVYRMTVRGAWDIQTYFVNARTGAIEEHRTEIRIQAAVSGLGTGVLRDRKKLSVTSAGSRFEAADRFRPAANLTMDFRGNVARLNLFLLTGVLLPSDIATSANNTWTDGAVVDAHVYQGLVYDYYFTRFGRRGIDDRNMPIRGIVHPISRADAPLYSPTVVGSYLNNAGYFGDGIMMYGDGDGRVFDYLAGGLDVVAHELTHGVTDSTSRLYYQDESGALNEAFSDIMATGIEFFVERDGQGPQKGPNFVIGEDVTPAAPGFLRSLENPNATGSPDHYSLRRYIGTPTDEGGVHFNSTIVSHAFYLAIMGGVNRVSGRSVQGVGLANMEHMERIFYRAFTFLMGPFSQFRDARAATLQAATDLYGAGSVDRAQLALAWDAVGVS